MTTREQAQWVLAVLLAVRPGDQIHVVSEIVRTNRREFPVWNLATDALMRAGFYMADGTRADMLAIRRAIRSLDEGHKP